MVLQVCLVAPITWRKLPFNGISESKLRMFPPPLENAENDQQQVVAKPADEPSSRNVRTIHLDIPADGSYSKRNEVVSFLLNHPTARTRHVIEGNVERLTRWTLVGVTCVNGHRASSIVEWQIPKTRRRPRHSMAGRRDQRNDLLQGWWLGIESVRPGVESFYSMTQNS